jgi:hypothetical protein
MADASPSTEKPKRPRNVVMDRTGCDKETASAALRSLGGDIDAATQAVLAEKEHEASAKRPRTEKAVAAPTANPLVIKHGVRLFTPQFSRVKQYAPLASTGDVGFKALIGEDDEEAEPLLCEVFIAPDDSARGPQRAITQGKGALGTTVYIDGKYQPHAFFTAKDGDAKLVLAGTMRDFAGGKKVLTVEDHKFKKGHPTLNAEDDAPVGPVVFLSDRSMIYAVHDDGTPAELIYWDPDEVQRHFITHDWDSRTQSQRPVSVGPARVEC